MAEQYITCPECGARIPLTEAFTRDIEDKLRLHYDTEMRRRNQEHATELKAKEREFQDSLAAERTRIEDQARKKALESVSLELKDKEQQLEEQRKKLAAAAQQELDLRKRQRDLEERERNLRLEVDRTLDDERRKIREETLKKVTEDHRMRELEKDKQLNDLRLQLDEMKRKMELTSQQMQGEVQEMELETVLRQQFRADSIEPVPKGIRGADVIQIVQSPKGQRCGMIIWESKRTKAWSDGWIQKLKDDQRLVKAEIAVLVTTVLPKDLNRFGFLDGIWVTDFASAVGLASALRENLLQLAYLRNSMAGMEEKRDQIYAYLTGMQFRQRIEAIVESFNAMKDDLEAEKRSIEKAWAKREMQINRMLKSTAGMYGDLQGIIGAALPDVKVLELPE